MRSVARCNRQIKTTDLIMKHPDVTRSTVQKAVVVLASKPVFGPIRYVNLSPLNATLCPRYLFNRDRLGVVTRTLFAQRDFSDLSILDAFHESLQGNLKSQLTESGFYMGGYSGFSRMFPTSPIDSWIMFFRNKPVSTIRFPHEVHELISRDK